MVLIDYDDKKETITFRHYRIELHYSKINKKVKKVLNLSKIPDLSSFNDISEFIKGK